MDFIILIFPIPWVGHLLAVSSARIVLIQKQILRMQMSLGKKVLVLGIFTLGGLYVHIHPCLQTAKRIVN
jgi:hypothetical protein